MHTQRSSQDLDSSILVELLEFQPSPKHYLGHKTHQVCHPSKLFEAFLVPPSPFESYVYNTDRYIKEIHLTAQYAFKEQ